MEETCICIAEHGTDRGVPATGNQTHVAIHATFEPTTPFKRLSRPSTSIYPYLENEPHSLTLANVSQSASSLKIPEELRLKAQIAEAKSKTLYAIKKQLESEIQTRNNFISQIEDVLFKGQNSKYYNTLLELENLYPNLVTPNPIDTLNYPQTNCSTI